MITTDYTARNTEDSLSTAPLTRYRLVHWLRDTVANYLADPENIPDERLRGLLRPSLDGEPGLEGLVSVGLPYSDRCGHACLTPAILVGVGAADYPVTGINTVIGFSGNPLDGMVAADRAVVKTVQASVAVVCESLDGLLLLADTLECFLLTHARQLGKDGPVSCLKVTGASDPSRVSMGDALNAKDLYQTVIGLSAEGSVQWTEDTQGPVFRGITPVG